MNESIKRFKDQMRVSLCVGTLAVALIAGFTFFAKPAQAADNVSTDASADADIPAPDVPRAKGKKQTGPKVLDFEADVIEGERKAPNLFLQLETDNPDLDTLMYRRNTFNDYHERERSRRPVYRKPAP